MMPDETIDLIANYRFVEPTYRHPTGGAWWPVNEPDVVTRMTQWLAQRAEALTLVAVQCAQAGHTHFHAGVPPDHAAQRCNPETRRCEVRAQAARSEVQTTTRTLLIKEFVCWLNLTPAGATTAAGPDSLG